MENDIPCKQNQKESQGRNICIRQNIFKTKSVTRAKDEHFIMMKRSIQQEDITLVNIYAPKIEAPKYIKQILTDIKREIDSNKTTVEDFNTHLQQCIDYLDRKSTRKQWR